MSVSFEEAKRRAERMLPEPAVKAIRLLRIQAQALRQELSPDQKQQLQRADACLLSYPKCGRTWLRLMMAHAIDAHFRLGSSNYLAISQMAEQNDAVPFVYVSHDGNPHLRPPFLIERSKAAYRNKLVVFLVRDPRDVVVSMFFHRSRRERAFSGDCARFVNHPFGGLGSIIAYYNSWAKQRHIPRIFHVVRYEALHESPAATLSGVLSAIGISDVSQTIIDSAVEFGRFENMREIERNNPFSLGPFRPGDVNDPDSYKTRRGKVGGYTDYLSPEAVERMNTRIRQELDPWFGYSD